MPLRLSLVILVIRSLIKEEQPNVVQSFVEGNDVFK